VKGLVEDVTQQSGRRGWSGIHLSLKTETETLDVHVGPSWFISQNQFSFAKGGQIEITGSKVNLGAGAALLAREIKKEGRLWFCATLRAFRSGRGSVVAEWALPRYPVPQAGKAERGSPPSLCRHRRALLHARRCRIRCP